ncbi:MAG: hemolysin III family protein [Lactobacillus sp.]|jgi:hemolysin III|nr:hemolysin III family protein [Lactobacillus sp.]MCI2033435.1 hemolysin III family protein [Lactobacillus sp.]
MQLSKSPYYTFTNESLSATTHAIGLGMSLIGTIALAVKGQGDPTRLASFIGFGAALILLYAASTAYHSFYFTKARHVLQVLDHSGVFILIAGSYLPYCLVAIGGALGWGLLIGIWALCLAGIGYKCFFIGKWRLVETGIYVLLGWLCLIGIQPLWQHLGPAGFWLLVGGGIAYTFGAVLYSQKQIPYIHVVWHLFVMLGSACMYASIYLFV